MVNESLSLLRKNSGVTLEYELEGQLEFSVPADAPNHLGYAAFNVRNVHKLKYRDEDGTRKKIKYKDHLNVNQFIVGLSGYLSLGPDFYL